MPSEDDFTEFFQLENDLRLCVRDYLDSLGISHLHFLYLMYIGTHKDCKVSEVASVARLDKASVTRALSTLDKLGYVYRRVGKADARSFILDLTPAGKAVTHGVGQVRQKWWDGIQSALSVGERDTLRALMRKAREKTASGKADALAGAALQDVNMSFFY